MKSGRYALANGARYIRTDSSRAIRPRSAPQCGTLQIKPIYPVNALLGEGFHYAVIGCRRASRRWRWRRGRGPRLSRIVIPFLGRITKVLAANFGFAWAAGVLALALDGVNAFFGAAFLGPAVLVGIGASRHFPLALRTDANVLGIRHVLPSIPHD